MEPVEVLANLTVMVFWAVVVGLLAKRKNRNPWLWALFGALSWVIALIVLAFQPYLCPHCREGIRKSEYKNDVCPYCDVLRGRSTGEA